MRYVLAFALLLLAGCATAGPRADLPTPRVPRQDCQGMWIVTEMPEFPGREVYIPGAVCPKRSDA